MPGNTATNATQAIKGTPVIVDSIIFTTTNKAPNAGTASTNYGVYADVETLKQDVYNAQINIDLFNTANWNLDADYPVWIRK